MHKLFLFVLISGYFLTALAQETDSVEVEVERVRTTAPFGLDDTLSNRGMFFSLRLGPSLVDLDDLNQELQRRQFESLQGNTIGLGFAASQYVGNWVWGAELISGTGQSRVNTQTSLLTLNHLTLQLGRVLYKPNDQQNLTIMTGLGGGLGILKVQDLLQANPTRYFSGGPVAEVSLNWNKYFFLEGSSLSVAYWGVSLGYQHTFDNTWIMRGYDPEGIGLRVSPAGWYLRLSLGMGNWSSFAGIGKE